MAARPKEPQQGNTTALAAVLLLATWASAPAFATSDRDIRCDDGQEITLEISEQELSATPVNASDGLLENHLLKPRVDATLREVFADGDDTSEVDETVEGNVETTESESAVRSVSDGDVTPLKRRMYRRDI